MFDYGDIPKKDPYFKECLEAEFFENSQYEKYVKVKEGDVVVDIGASIGPFLYTIKDRNPSQVIAVEPMPAYHNLLLKNSVIQGLPSLKLHRNAIGANDGDILDLEWSSEREKVETISFNTIISENNLSHIDFLKLDCEGGEYDVFSEDNVPFLLTVPKIVTEFHLHGNIGKAKFREFRDIFLKAFPNHEVYSIDGVNIKWDLWNEHFLEYYQEILIYIDNIFKNCCKFII